MVDCGGAVTEKGIRGDERHFPTVEGEDREDGG